MDSSLRTSWTSERLCYFPIIHSDWTVNKYYKSFAVIQDLSITCPKSRCDSTRLSLSQSVSVSSSLSGLPQRPRALIAICPFHRPTVFPHPDRSRIYSVDSGWLKAVAWSSPYCSYIFISSTRYSRTVLSKDGLRSLGLARSKSGLTEAPKSKAISVAESLYFDPRWTHCSWTIDSTCLLLYILKELSPSARYYGFQSRQNSVQ